MVDPDREIPGVMANPWAKPIPMACPHFNPWAGVSPLSFLVNQKVPVTANAAPTAAGVWKSFSKRSSRLRPIIAVGTSQQRATASTVHRDAPRTALASRCVNNHARQICAVDPQHRNECPEVERKVEGQRVSNDREPRLKKDQVPRLETGRTQSVPGRYQAVRH